MPVPEISLWEPIIDLDFSVEKHESDTKQSPRLYLTSSLPNTLTAGPKVHAGHFVLGQILLYKMPVSVFS